MAHENDHGNDHDSAHFTIPRRSFLKLITTGLIAGNLLACTHKKFFNPDEDILLSGGSYGDDDELQDALIIINLTQKEKRLIDTPFLPHQICIDPNNKYRVVCFEKNGTNACEIDLQTQLVSGQLLADDKRIFSGHATFTHDGKQILSIESDTENDQGVISFRDSKTFEVIKTLPTLGLLPHDCYLTADDALIVSNTGSDEPGLHQPSLVYIDLATEKLIERIKLDDAGLINGGLNCGHFKVTPDNELVIASAPVNTEDKTLSGGVSIRKQDGPLTTMTEPELVIKRMTGEALGIEINQHHKIVAITHPDANLLTFWSLADKTLVKAFGIEKPRGICQTLNKQDFIVSYGEIPAMANVSTSDLTPQADSIVQPTLASGEHMINWSTALREIMPKRVYD
jgi:uncharacterized protein